MSLFTPMISITIIQELITEEVNLILEGGQINNEDT